ncbi:MAG: Hpt domain-containing protein [Bacteroidia bacterium]|nr:Hpt domain-containing protein [Bacteroidia bacterium]MBT8311127.1 Hpt domain-containing protein [Bacteroidia bacterium]NND10238.1 Hpt domain-containing protein [Flavobacteriaceae bacterium]NNK28840.1 Hpt domain-containing protein [Flavobacteriaceae bacterium]
MKESPNLEYIEELSGGDKAFKDKLISIIKKEFPQEELIYKTNLASKNYVQVAGNVHKIKHKISILGLVKSYELAEKYEHELLENKTDLKEEFESILAKIKLFLEQL